MTFASPRFLLLLLFAGTLSACGPSPVFATPSVTVPTLPLTEVETTRETLSATSSPMPSETLASSETPALPTPTATLKPEIADLCSPMADIPLADLVAAVSNPYHPPRQGSDDPHYGVDFADTSGPGGMAIPGQSVQAVLPGAVATVIRERFPYGNALIVETSLDILPAARVGQLGLPDPIPTIQPISLTCPTVEGLPVGSGSERSLYLLYAHMQAPPELEPGDPVSCGKPIGEVGESGNALNPHLHLEMRVGAAGARLESLAHYDAGASLQEMAAYCAWRVQGYFQSVDPLLLFK